MWCAIIVLVSAQHSPSNDFAYVGSASSDPCFEAKIQSKLIQEWATTERALFDAYKWVLADCGSGKFHMDCVVEAFYEKEPTDFLKLCLQERGPQPVNSAAVCRYAKQKVEKLTHFAHAWGHIAWIMKQVHDNCKKVPYQCITMANACLDAIDITFCFKHCLRTGNMPHQVQA
eukprot:GEMP01067103.1.p1 GENE.GEMP01067103.1~~GEMP01067103.1.p1  ORF type:complete len:173 (-),score=25.56 GEMP01067103.1:676-1194(-)